MTDLLSILATALSALVCLCMLQTVGTAIAALAWTSLAVLALVVLTAEFDSVKDAGKDDAR